MRFVRKGDEKFAANRRASNSRPFHGGARDFTQKNAGQTVCLAGVLMSFRSDQGMSPATNFGMTGPPISAAKRRFDGEKKNKRPPIWLSVS
jgi:hypothetical protein